MPRKKIVPPEETEQAVAQEEPGMAQETADSPPTTPSEEGQTIPAEEAPPMEDTPEPPQGKTEPEADPTPPSNEVEVLEDSSTAPTTEGENAPMEDAPVPVEPPKEEVRPTRRRGRKSETAEPPAPAEESAPAMPERPTPPITPPVSDRQQFFSLDFNVLDRNLTAEERQEWNSIYASYRGRSALTGTIIGVDPHSIRVWNQKTEEMEKRTMYCAIVVPYRVRVVIPATEMWEPGHERPDFVLQNMVGATIDFIITKVDRENGFAIASRSMALRAQRYFFAHRPALNGQGSMVKCRVLSIGPRRCLVECYGHDINLTQRELRYTAIPDLRDEYHPGQELDAIVKSYDPARDALTISVKETEANPFDGAEVRHPEGSRRQAVIAGKYGGGVFCNLPDGTVCMCNYSYQYKDSDFQVGDTVILVIQRHEPELKQMYGKILTKW